ncbi:MAG TPA: hypothetical protein VNG90_00810 [Candidatus Acidoferrum sp.]|nr:hypothetical protein [Candidatus Acidoferrum sp.]
MNYFAQQRLKHELRQAGASPDELEGLASIAGQLKLLRVSSIKTPRRTPRFALAAIPALGAAFFLVIAFAQTVLPGSWLYPVQQLSDAAIVAVHPEYRAALMMKQAKQVNQLVVQHARPDVVIATLVDYDRTAAAYKTARHVNYAAFEQCKTSLQQAAAHATAEVRSVILASLGSLENV